MVWARLPLGLKLLFFPDVVLMLLLIVMSILGFKPVIDVNSGADAAQNYSLVQLVMSDVVYAATTTFERRPYFRSELKICIAEMFVRFTTYLKEKSWLDSAF
jgi:CDP-diglyceride synthetase